MSQNKAAFFNLFLELVIAVHCSDTAVAIIQCFLINIRLDFLKQVFYVFLDTVARAGFFLQRIAAHHFHCIVLQVAATHNQTDRYTFHLVIGKLEARTFVVGIVVLHRNTHRFQFGYDACHLLVNLGKHFGILVDRYDNHLYRSQVRRKHQTVVIGMCHDKRTHQAGRYSPRSGPYVFQFVFLVYELHVESFGEVLSQEV